MKENKKAIRLFIIATILFSVALALLVIILSTPVFAYTIGGERWIQRYDDVLIRISQLNIDNGNWTYLKTENSTNYILQREDDTLTLQKANYINYGFLEDEISLTINTKASNVQNISQPNGTGQRYILLPQSAKMISKLFDWDNKLPIVVLSNQTWTMTLLPSDNWYSNVGGLRYNFKTANVTGLPSDVNVTFSFNSWVINGSIGGNFWGNNISITGGHVSPNTGYIHDNPVNGITTVLYPFDCYGFGCSGTIIYNENTSNTNTNGTLSNFASPGNISSGWNGSQGLNFDPMMLNYVDMGSSSLLNINWSLNYTVAAVFIPFNAAQSSTLGGVILDMSTGSNNRNGLVAANSILLGGNRNGTTYIGRYSTTIINRTKYTGVFTNSNRSSIYLYLNTTNQTGVGVPSFFASMNRVGASGTVYYNGSIQTIIIDNGTVYNQSMVSSINDFVNNTNITAWWSPPVNDVISSFIINESVPFGANYSVDYSNDNASWVNLQTAQTNSGNNTINITGTKYNNISQTYIRIRHNGTNVSVPTLIMITFVNTSDVFSSGPVISNITGNFYVNHSWTVPGTISSSNLFNVSVNSVWNNVTQISFANNTYSAHAWQNISVCRYDSINSLNGTCASQNTQIPNNIPVPKTTIHATYLVDTGTTLNFSINATDADLDSLTYSSNNTIGTFNTTTGNFSYTGVDADAGNYTFYFKVDDGYGGIVSQTTTITEESVTQMLLAALANLPTKADVSNAGAMGLMGGIVGGAMATMAIRRLKRKTVK